MTMITVEQLKRLSFAEKLQLVKDLWDDIAQDAASQAISPELERELEQALEEYRLNPNEGESWDAVKTEILRTLS
ncbi:MAG: addiction module protein [Gammaproteobacteria bacterium]|nr:addiction module protein [Gammaproteobacteria bacterium]